MKVLFFAAVSLLVCLQHAIATPFQSGRIRNAPGPSTLHPQYPLYPAVWGPTYGWRPTPIKNGPRTYSRFDPANPFRWEQDYNGQRGYLSIPVEPALPVIRVPDTPQIGAFPRASENPSPRSVTPVRPAQIRPNEESNGGDRNKDGKPVDRPGPVVIQNPFL